MANTKGPNGAVASFTDVVHALERRLANERQMVIERLLAQVGDLKAQLAEYGYNVVIQSSTRFGYGRKGQESGSGRLSSGSQSGRSGSVVGNGRTCPICSAKHGVEIKGHDMRSHRYHREAYTRAEIKSMKEWQSDPVF